MLAFQFVAILAATLFSGAAIYINLAEHPARMECGTELAATVFGPSYRRAAVMQIILALAATIAGMAHVGRCSQTVGTYKRAAPGKYIDAYLGRTST